MVCGQASAVCCLFQYKSKVSRNETSRGQVENKGRWSAMYQVADLQNSPKGYCGHQKLTQAPGETEQVLGRELLRVTKETETTLG